MRTEIDNNKIRQQKKFLDFFVVTKQLQSIILRGDKDMASFHAIEQVMNMIITREGNPIKQNKIISIDEYFDESDKTQINNRIGICIKNRLNKKNETVCRF